MNILNYYVEHTILSEHAGTSSFDINSNSLIQQLIMIPRVFIFGQSFFLIRKGMAEKLLGRWPGGRGGSSAWPSG